MQGFKQFIESSLRDQLNVPQNPKHHPEGSVAIHSGMVRAAMNSALDFLRHKQSENPDGPLSNLDFNLSKEDINLLRVMAWLHDVGKKSSLDQQTLSAHGHESPEMFEKGMQGLGSAWQKMYDQSSLQDKEDLWFGITNHMSLSNSQGFGKRLRNQLIDNEGKYRNERKVKLLLAITTMDRMGRGSEPGSSRLDRKSFASNNREEAEKRASGMYASSDIVKQKQNSLNVNRSIAPSSPVDFAKFLKAKNQPDSVIKTSMVNKFPELDQREIEDIVGAI